jgi:hypothetical protein
VTRLEIDPEFIERMIASVAAALGVPESDVSEAVNDFLQDEIRDLEAINAVLALGVDKRPGGPNDGADGS